MYLGSSNLIITELSAVIMAANEIFYSLGTAPVRGIAV